MNDMKPLWVALRIIANVVLGYLGGIAVSKTWITPEQHAYIAANINEFYAAIGSLALLTFGVYKAHTTIAVPKADPVAQIITERAKD